MAPLEHIADVNPNLTILTGRNITMSRRSLLSGGALSLASILACGPIASASSELDKQSGQLFVPKAKMLGGGGSDETRGISLNVIDRSQDVGGKRSLSRVHGPIQTVYETRFIAYLSRFLLNYDPAAKSWWESGLPESSPARALRFAQFAESVEVGLADYFVGPYGSYASVNAARAGLAANKPAVSTKVESNIEDKSISVVQSLLFPSSSQSNASTSKKRKPLSQTESEKQGVLNLLALLQARYKSYEQKLQLAMLFSMISDISLQPIQQITSLLGEADDGSLKEIQLVPGADLSGYADAPVDVKIDPPPALGDNYLTAQAVAYTRPTSRILRIRVVDGGEGYASAPKVTISAPTGDRRVSCEAVATIDRYGSVDSIFVIDPGFGYGRGYPAIPPIVKVATPVKKSFTQNGEKVDPRPCIAVAELEFEVYNVSIVEKGNGYVISQPPRITFSPPEERDWTVMNLDPNKELAAVVTQMSGKSIEPAAAVSSTTLYRLHRDPIELLPLSARPIHGTPKEFDSNVMTPDNIYLQPYVIPGLPAVPSRIELPSSQYAAYDPVFGGVGIAPVTKGALSLSASQYARLALSGAICTVIVRTMLNPLELIKTKIQLGNDEELMNHVRQVPKVSAPIQHVKQESKVLIQSIDYKNMGGGTSSQTPILALETDTKIASQVVTRHVDSKEDLTSSEVKSRSNSLGTAAVAKGLIELRGPLALFQSADITLLASLVFGGLGFGATELFRRFFTALFFEVGWDGRSEVILLGAAALATVLTAFAATPFELLRVRSMGLINAKPWRQVLTDFLAEKRKEASSMSSDIKRYGSSTSLDISDASYSMQNVVKDGIKALLTPFPKIVSRELPFALAKFLAFDTVAKLLESVINSSLSGATPVQVGVGPEGLAISAFSGAVAGLAGAVVSHPADLILTLTSASAKKQYDGVEANQNTTSMTWQDIVKDLLAKDGGVANLFVGLPARLVFFFLVIGLQFFLYDYVKNLLSVGSDDLSLVLDVFYAVRQGLV